jgi:hypothetical protein
MALSLSAKLTNMPDVTGALKRFQKESGVPVKFVLSDQMRLWLQDLAKLGPPKKKKTGKKAIERDINKIFAPIDNKTLIAAWNNSMATEGSEIIRSWNRQKVKMTRKQLTSAKVKKMVKIHQKHRRKDGRVKFKSKRNEAWGGRSIVPRKVLKKYIRQVQKSVGKLKGSWVEPMQKMARAARTSAVFPAWIAQAEGRKGSARTSGKFNFGTGKVTATNKMPYAAKKFASFLPTTLLKRQKDITGSMFKRMEKIMNQFNGGR